MPKTAFLFPGQGSQTTGMGRDLADAFPASKAVFEQADEALEFPISKLCFEGPDEDLRLTENTQPAILTCSIAALAAVRGKGLEADYVAGHSLGEYPALVAAGALDFADAVRLVRAARPLHARGRAFRTGSDGGADRAAAGEARRGLP